MSEGDTYVVSCSLTVSWDNRLLGTNMKRSPTLLHRSQTHKLKETFCSCLFLFVISHLCVHFASDFVSIFSHLCGCFASFFSHFASLFSYFCLWGPPWRHTNPSPWAPGFLGLCLLIQQVIHDHLEQLSLNNSHNYVMYVTPSLYVCY